MLELYSQRVGPAYMRDKKPVQELKVKVQQAYS